LKIIEILAQTTQRTNSGGWPELLRGPLVPILLILLVFYIFVMRSKRGETRKREEMLHGLTRGDRVQTIGGMLGTVVEVRDNEVLVKVDESSNTKVRFVRSAIHRVVEEEKSGTK
jgi:preprotein translocase subunit YajC